MSRSLLILLAALIASTPLAIDAYLPAMPQMASFFGTTIHDVELSLSLFLGGFAVGQLIGGPFSDHFGRRYTIFTGLTIYCLGSIGILLSPSIEWVWVCRVIQAFGGGVAVVNATAIVRDLSHGQEAARHMSNMMVIMMAAPLLAPVIGTSLLYLGNWQLIFIVLLAYGLVLMMTLYFQLPETHTKQQDRPSALNRYWMVLSNRSALGFILAQCFATGSMFVFVASAPGVFMGIFGVSKVVFPAFFAINVIAMVLFNRINVYLLRYYSAKSLMAFGQIWHVSAATILLLYVMLIGNDANVYVYSLLTLVVIGGLGFISSNANSCTIEYFPHNSATATAITGALGFACGSLSGTVVSLLGDGTLKPIALIAFSCTVLALILRKAMHHNVPDKMA